MGVLVPLYGYPLVSSGSGATRTTAPNPAWETVAANASAAPTIAVINPSNGPMPCSSPPSADLLAFQHAIAQLHQAGVTVLGYVHTSHGQRSLTLVRQDVQTYAQCYGVDGVFFDEVSNQASLANYYATAAATVRQDISSPSGKPALVAINPGTYPDLSIANTADITVMHESVDLNRPPAPPALSSYALNKYAYLAYGISNLPQIQTATLTSLFQQGIGYVDLTDQGNGADPWATLSTQYSSMIQNIQTLNRTLPPSTFCYGVGDRLNWMQTSSQFISTPQALAQLGFPASNRMIGLWLGSNWDSSYFTGIQEWMNQGSIPVVIYYYGGDLAQYGNQAWSHVESLQTAWLADAKRLGKLLSTLNGTVLVVIQPEWNIPTLQDNTQFGQFLAQVAQTIRANASHPALHLRIGTAVGDFGNYSLVQDPYWSSFDTAMKALLPSLDFTGFQEMRAAQHLDAQGAMTTYTAAQEGLSTLGPRALAFAQYLQSHYHKPILIPYVEVASYTPAGDQENWTTLSAQGYGSILQQSAELKQAGVFGLMANALFDDNSHNNSGTDYFGQASTTYGLVKSNGGANSPLIGSAPYTLKPSAQTWITETKNSIATCIVP